MFVGIVCMFFCALCTTVSQASFTQSYSNIIANSQSTLALTHPFISYIQPYSLASLSSVTLTITDLNEKPVPDSLSYVTISLSTDLVRDYKIGFKTPRSETEFSKVRILHLRNGSWIQVTPLFLRNDNEFNYFIVTLPSLGNIAIVKNPQTTSSPSQNSTTNQTTNTSALTSLNQTNTPNTTTAQKATNEKTTNTTTIQQNKTLNESNIITVVDEIHPESTNPITQPIAISIIVGTILVLIGFVVMQSSSKNKTMPAPTTHTTLVDYIKHHQSTEKSQMVAQLLQAGWDYEYISAAWDVAHNQISEYTKEFENLADEYRHILIQQIKFHKIRIEEFPQESQGFIWMLIAIQEHTKDMPLASVKAQMIQKNWPKELIEAMT